MTTLSDKKEEFQCPTEIESFFSNFGFEKREDGYFYAAYSGNEGCSGYSI